MNKNDEQKISLIVNDLLPKLNDKQQKIIQMRFLNEQKKEYLRVLFFVNHYSSLVIKKALDLPSTSFILRS